MNFAVIEIYALYGIEETQDLGETSLREGLRRFQGRDNASVY